MELRSSLTGPIQTFIDLRRLSGTDYKGQAQLPGYFDRFLCEQKWNMTHITREITDLYPERLSHLAPRSRSNRFSVVRQLCKYVARSDSDSFVPEPLKAVPSRGAHQPYIYTRSEIRMLLSASYLPDASGASLHSGNQDRRSPGAEFGTLPERRKAPIYCRRQVPKGPLCAVEPFHISSP
jgi:hypothetical protein